MRQTGAEISGAEGMKSLSIIFHLGVRFFFPWPELGSIHVFSPTLADVHSEVGQESSLSTNAMTRALSASLSRGIVLPYTYNRHKSLLLQGGQESLWVTQGQAVV